jgi:hypothetical protein
MTRPQYAPVPRGYVRVWLLTIEVEGLGSIHGEVFVSRHAADAERKHFKVPAWVTPLDVPAGAIPGLADRRERKR